jgi:hypothetical protein
VTCHAIAANRSINNKNKVDLKAKEVHHMKPSALSGVDGGAAYVPPPAPSAAARHGSRGRSNVVAAASSASGTDGGGSGSGGGTNEISSSTTEPPSSYPRLGASPLPHVRIKKRGRHYDVHLSKIRRRRRPGEDDDGGPARPDPLRRRVLLRVL